MSRPARTQKKRPTPAAKGGAPNRTLPPPALAAIPAVSPFAAAAPPADVARLMAESMQAHQSGRLDDAERGYRQILALQPNHADVLHLLGLSFIQRTHYAEALPLIQQAIAITPNWPYFGNLGMVLNRLGRKEESEMAYRRALLLNPNFSEAHYNFGNLLNDLKRHDEAEAAYRNAMRLNPNFVDTYLNLANLLKEKKRFAEAEELFRRALQLKPDYADLYLNYGNLLKELKRNAEAEAAYQQALRCKPNFHLALMNYGILLKELKRYAEAEAAYVQTLRAKPDHVDAYVNLGNMLRENKRYAEAEGVLRRLVQIKPDLAAAHNNMGILLNEIHRYEEAEESFRRAMILQPEYAGARWNLSWVLLYLGKYAEGWQHYEAGYDPEVQERKAFPPKVDYPQWHGESLVGKSLMIWPEQGHGDMIQFCRYVPLLKEKGARWITMVCAAPLKPLFETIRGVDTVLASENLDPIPTHDFWMFPLSAPLHCGTTLENVPNEVPYVHPLPERIAYWRERIPRAKRRVGLVWRGNSVQRNDIHRSLPGLSTLAPLWTVPDTVFISLQKGDGEDEARNPPSNQPLTHLGSDMRDFADAAAIVEQLDLVISVCTAGAHLAGSVGKTCWVMLTSVGTDWRWMDQRSDSPWYPGMRLFRQRDPNQWDVVVEEVRQALMALP